MAELLTQPKGNEEQILALMAALGQHLIPDYLKNRDVPIPMTPEGLLAPNPEGKVPQLNPSPLETGTMAGIDLATAVPGGAAKSILVGPLAAAKNINKTISERGMRKGVDTIFKLSDEELAHTAGPGLNKAFKETGWTLGAEGQPRAEILDTMAGLNPNLPRNPYNTDLLTFPQGTKNELLLRDVLRHPELFEAYPDLQGVGVRGTPTFATHSGEYNPNKDVISLTGAQPHEVRSTLLHEIQHAVQEREGFAPGGNVEQFLPKNFKALEQGLQAKENELRSILEGLGLNNLYLTTTAAKSGGSLPHYQAILDLLKQGEQTTKQPLIDTLIKLDKAGEAMQTLRNTAFDKYRNLAGEVEARNVARRADLPEGTLKAYAPATTEDVPRQQQLLLKPQDIMKMLQLHLGK